MNAFTTDTTRPFQSSFDAARLKRKRRRSRYRLRYFVSIIAIGAIALGRKLLWALQDSRGREAARVIDHYRHLRQDPRRVDDSHWLHRAGADARQIKFRED